MRRTLVGPSSAARPAPAAAPRPLVQKGGLAVSWRANVGSVACVAQSSACLAVATDDGAVVFVDNAGDITARSPQIADEGPNAMDFSPRPSMLVACYDDGYARVLQSTTRITSVGRNGAPVRGEAPLRSLGTSADFAMVVEHQVAPPPVAGKRARTIPATHCAAIADPNVHSSSDVCAIACSAGKLVHCVDVPSGELRHAHTFDAPVRALCRDPLLEEGTQVTGYYVAYGTTIARVTCTNDGPAEGEGQITKRYTSTRPLRSLAPREDGWLTAGTFDGAIEVWGKQDTYEPFELSLQSFCRSDGEALAWSSDGGFLATTGARAACFDFTGQRPHHPYRRPQYDDEEDVQYEPDAIPRVCGFAETRERCVAWAPGGAILATVDAVGVVRLWNLRGRLKKGGQGHPQQPQLMKPQFFLFPQLDAAHPSGDAAKPAFVGWLSADTVAVAYECGDIVAFRVAPPPAVAAAPPPQLIFDKATDPKNVM